MDHAAILQRLFSLADGENRFVMSFLENLRGGGLIDDENLAGRWIVVRLQFFELDGAVLDGFALDDLFERAVNRGVADEANGHGRVGRSKCFRWPLNEAREV